MKLLANTYATFPSLRKDVKIVYCDTGVENLVVSEFVKTTLQKLSEELESFGLKDCVEILRPHITQRYFVRMIGRGYPPPTQFFRWCTTDLRIRPVQNFLKMQAKNALVIVGTRSGESAQRDRQLGTGPTSGPFIQKQIENGAGTFLYSPIIGFSLEDVWETLVTLDFPTAINTDKLLSIYRDGGGECPVVREPNDKPCSSARFGCWTCTVVRRDKSAEKMIQAGHAELLPFHSFRDWLSRVRNEPSMRCKRRRNGSRGFGPFNLNARKKILKEVRKLEATTNVTVIDEKELKEIRRLWKIDRQSPAYRKIESAN